MDRRDFLSLVAAGGAAVSLDAEFAPGTPVSKLDKPVPQSLHDRLMTAGSRVVSTIDLPSGKWRIMWTGMNYQYMTETSYATWFACWDDQDTRHEHYGVYVAVPGSWGSLDRGEAMLLDARFPQRLRWGVEGEEIHYADKSSALTAIIELLSHYDWKKINPTDGVSWYQARLSHNANAWKYLSERSKFYLDCGTWMEEQGLNKHDDNSRMYFARQFGFLSATT